MSGAAFNAGTLPDMQDCVTHVQSNINRGTLGSSTKPTITEVERWLTDAKQRLVESHGFTWERVYAYMDTTTNEYRYALPADFGQGGFVIREVTTSHGKTLTVLDPVSFDRLFPDVPNEASDAPTYATIKDRELWLSAPAGGTYRLEMEYLRTGDDTTPNDISYIPELMRFKMCDYATYRSFLVLQMWEIASIYKTEWESSLSASKKRDGRKRWSAIGYKVRPYII